MTQRPLPRCGSCAFKTSRLDVREWHTSATEFWGKPDLPRVIVGVLSDAVTQSLPTGWQGPYSEARARSWIADRDLEGTTLLAVTKSSHTPIGLLILHETESESGDEVVVHLGYVISESAWGQGIATELLEGFIAWCRDNRVSSVVAGVDRSNIASVRVLEKNGFAPTDRQEPEQREVMYRLVFRRNMRTSPISGLQRICIVGCSGSGKSTLAQTLGNRTGISITHLDRLFWQPGWIESDRDRFEQTLGQVLARDSWILDGNFGRTAAMRFQKSQVIIFLDYPTWRCVLGVLRRVATTYGKVRPDMGEGCPERFDWSFLQWIVGFRKPGNSRDKLLQSIEEHGKHCRVLQPRNPRELQAMISNLIDRRITAAESEPSALPNSPI